MNNQRKIVFISYSWDSSEHQEWVLELSKDLIKKFGIEVILDQYELSAGKDLTYFMESSIEKADKVLVILTPKYKSKAEHRESGVGYETSMISQEIFESPISKVKFIPILRTGTQVESTPKFLKSKLYHHMNGDLKYINKLYELSRNIYDKPLLEKPELGDIPNFETHNLDPIIDIAVSVSKEAQLNDNLNILLESSEGVEIFQNETNKIDKTLKEKVEYYKTSSPIQFKYESNNRDTAIISALGYSVSFWWSLAYSNTLKDSKLLVSNWKITIRINNGYNFPGEAPKATKKVEYSFDLNYDKEVVWKSNFGKVSTTEIMQNAFLYLIECIKEEKSKNFRKE